MTFAGIILILGFIIIMVIGAPIYMAVFSGCTISALVEGINLQMLVQRGYAANDSFPYLAILFFCVAGDLMLQGGIGKRIVDFCSALTKKSFGRLSNISFIACAFFGALSGSQYATTTTIGKLMFPEMVRSGYTPEFSALVQAVGGTLGVLIPPSIMCVLYGNLTGVSVGAMLLYIAPVGIITTVVYILIGQYMMRRKKNPTYVPNAYVKQQEAQDISLGAAFKDAFWALLTPVIILGGIYAGVFTPTECAVVATIYAWIVGTFVYKELDLQKTFNALVDSAVASGAIMIIINAANVLSWLFAYYGVATVLANFVESIVSNKIFLLFLFNVVYIIIGMFVESCVTISIIVPLLFPIAMRYGVNGVHLGCITVLNCLLGTITPPFGGAVFVSSAVTRVPVQDQFKVALPYIIGGFAWCFILTFVPLLWL